MRRAKADSDKAWRIRNVIKRVSVIMFALLHVSGAPATALAEIRFDDVSAMSGIHKTGPTYGASWGDFNGDGWPDLWVGNHNTKPTLYLNRQDGTFEDIIDRVWSGDPRADTHGAAWADFDNDGDQDLMEVVAASENPDGTFCLGCGKNQLFVNEDGKLFQRSGDFGLDQTGNARSPQWLDANRDGLLDLLVANTSGDGLDASRIYIQDQRHRFADANARLGFKDGPWSRSERLRGWFENLLHLSFKGQPRFNIHRHLEFAQLADLSSDGRPDLILLATPTRVFDIQPVPFKDITSQVGLPDLSRVKDLAIADVDGDLEMDLVAAEGTWLAPHVIQDNPNELKGMITWSGGNAPKSVSFRSNGEVHFQIYPTWLPLSNVFIGIGGRRPEARAFTLSPNDASVYGSPVPSDSSFEGVAIDFNPESKVWTIRNFQRSIFVDFIARSTEVISHFQTNGFKLFEADGSCRLYLRQKKGALKPVPLGKAGENTACISLVAGDFDNDMDVDLYLVRTGPIMNFPNHLLENVGRGNFIQVPDAGGAAGTAIGRGDVVVAADYDRDGFLDLFVANGSDPTSPFVAEAPHQLFRNRGNANHWLEIDLEGVSSNRDAIGARVTVEAGGITQVREQTGGMHRFAQNHQRLHFGLGGQAQADRVAITWPSGKRQHIEAIQADQILHVVEPSGDVK